MVEQSIMRYKHLCKRSRTSVATISASERVTVPTSGGNREEKRHDASVVPNTSAAAARANAVSWEQGGGDQP